jgi:hypothetical protein
MSHDSTNPIAMLVGLHRFDQSEPDKVIEPLFRAAAPGGASSRFNRELPSAQLIEPQLHADVCRATWPDAV